jgi:exo-beta-1,3-glucanase (GH17 family)
MTRTRILRWWLIVIVLLASAACGVTTATTTTTTTATTTTTTSSTTTSSSTASSTTSSQTTTSSTTTTTTTTSVLSNSPLPANDTRPEATFANGQIVIDNDNREYTYRNARAVTTSDPTAYGSSYTDSFQSSRFIGTFTPTITTAGYYKIYINSPILENPSDEVVLQIDYEGGNNSDYTKTLNQTINAGYWVMVGTYYLSTGNGNAVHLFGKNGYDVAADAVLFVLSVATPTLVSEEPLVSRNPKTPGSVANILMTRDFKFRYSVDGELFYIRGVDGIDELALMAEAGANAVRTYSIDALQNGALLDEAQRLGIKVVVGLWMDHESTSFTYAGNPSAVQQQYLELIAEVEKYKTHPAVMGWAVGNEVDISTSANPLAIYAAINAIAKYIHESDPYHPTMAVLAGSSTTKIANIMRYSPHIDIIGINTYKNINNVAANIASWKGPYSITEFALNQPSETTLKTSWGAIIEPATTDKADAYYTRYQDYILGKSDQGCIGSFVFKDTGGFRVTHTWYGLVYDGMRTPQFYAMKSAWMEIDRIASVSITNVTINGLGVLNNVNVTAGSAVTVQVSVDNPKGELLTFVYEVRKEVSISSNSVPAVRSDFVFDVQADPTSAYLTIPGESGGFRLYVYVFTPSGDVSTYNFPFYINPQA